MENPSDNNENRQNPILNIKQMTVLIWGSALSSLTGFLALVFNTNHVVLINYWGITSLCIGILTFFLRKSNYRNLPISILAFLQPLLWPSMALINSEKQPGTFSFILAILLLVAWFPILSNLLPAKKHKFLNKVLIAYNALIGGICVYFIISNNANELNSWEAERVLLLALILMMILNNWLHSKSETWRTIKLQNLTDRMTREYTQSKENFESLVLNLKNTFFLQFDLLDNNKIGYTYISTNCDKQFGINLNDLIVDPNRLQHLLHPEDLSLFSLTLNNAFENKQSFEHVSRFKYSSGQFHWTRFIYQLNENEGKKSTYNVMLQDIHENFLLEERIRESQQFLHRLTSSLPDALFSIEYNSGSPIFLTGHYLRLLGYSSSELRAMENFPQNLIPNEHLPDFLSFWKRIDFKFGQIHEIEIPLKIKDGCSHWFLLRTSLLKINSQHQPLHLLMILTNIEQRKETENRLKKSEERYERAVNGTNDGIWEWKMDTGEFTVSDRFLNNIGFVKNDWENTIDFWESLIEPTHRDLFWEHINLQEDSYKSIDIEIKVLHKIFGYRWFHVRGSSIQNANEHFIISGSLRDINSVKMDRLALKDSKETLESLTEELKNRNQQLENYADITSHNLRSPISNILSLVDLIPLESDPEQILLLTQKMKQTANNLNATLYDLHKVLKIKRTTELSKNEIEFEKIFNQVRDSLMHQIMETNAEIIGDFSGAPTIVYHQPYLESILLNLMTNAIKYRSSDRPPIILIETRLIDGDITLICKDNGLGIDLVKHGHKVFGLHKTFHRNKDSRGVGLFMTRNQIESQGGTINIKSAPEMGSTFTIRF